MKYGFGVDLGGTTVKIAYFAETGAMLDKWEIPTVTEDGGEKILPDIAASISKYREDNSIDDDSLLGIGIGVPGPVNGRGVVNKCVNLGWGVFNIQDVLSGLTCLPVKAGNDANVAALGEFWMGGDMGSENMVFVTLGTGVGGGIVVDGKLLHGAHGSGAEIGHLVLNRDETAVCGCGKRGCVEQYCSATGIVRLAKLRLEKNAGQIFPRAEIHGSFAADGGIHGGQKGGGHLNTADAPQEHAGGKAGHIAGDAAAQSDNAIGAGQGDLA